MAASAWPSPLISPTTLLGQVNARAGCAVTTPNPAASTNDATQPVTRLNQRPVMGPLPSANSPCCTYRGNL